ncbi:MULTISPECIES: hypothetical protein [unclassified Haloarcula]|jgi:hypothetical protein|uniref:hypothetical protein n=1 Tax=Haloarcula sp. K1 TaxID=1622207 RepID=UPI0007BBAE7C|nr:hypothetical protein [Haloarcula sp. K1]KZX46317.1 hypothetical protein AV929_16230 [Haloarcula sp. K1]
MIDISELRVGNTLVGKKYGKEWKVAGTVTDIETGERVGVLVNDGLEGSIRTDAFDQDDLTEFQKKHRDDK